MPTLACPTRDELSSYLVGKLPAQRCLEIDMHLPACTDCQQTLDTVSAKSDTLLSQLGGRRGQSEFLNEPECREAIARVEAIGREPSFTTRGQLAAAAGAKSFPERVGPYRLLAQLGQGGMGAVYKALHTKLDRVVALKLLPGERMQERGAVARFEREMRAVGKLDHPNIVRASDADEKDGLHYLVMEYVEGLDLSELVQRAGPLPIADACAAIRHAAVGLQHAYENGLVHRDIKPSNLMLTTDGQIKVLDLGLALLEQSGDDEHTAGRDLTSTGQTMGTLDYMAPEQGGDSHEVDIRADIYALGATLYKLLTGEPIYAGRQYRNAVQKLRALAMEPAPAIQSRRRDIPDDLARVIHQMIAKEPADRFATPREVAAALAPFAAGADLAGLLTRADQADTATVTPAGSTTSLAQEAIDRDTWRPQERSSAAEAPTAASQPIPASNTAREPAAPKPRSKSVRRRVAIAAIGLALLGVLAAAAVFVFRTPQGTVTIEIPEGVDAKDIKVVALQGGREIEVADQKSGWKIRLREGEYQFDLRGGGDRLKLDKNRVTVTRNDRQILAIKVEPNQPPAVAPTDTDPNREVAKAVFALGGWVTYRSAEGKFTDARTIDELEKGAKPLQVVMAGKRIPPGVLSKLRLLKNPIRLEAPGSLHDQIAGELAGAPVTSINAHSTPLTRKGLKELARIDVLKELRLTSVNIEPDDYELLTNFPSLEIVTLGMGVVSRRG